MKTPDWHERKPSNRPPGRVNAVLVYDAAKQYTLLFGGHAQMNPKNDSWLWDGSDWREVMFSSPANPSKRYSAVAAYDAIRGQIVMFGGNDGSNNFFDDTWLFDGVWKQANPMTKPEARQEAVMAFDPVTKMCLLFGGDGTLNTLDDSWAWDGADWKWLQPQTIPAARSHAAMATDSARKQILLFGGQNNGGGFLADTWIWDGTMMDWIAKAVHGPGPKARYRHSMAENTASAEVILFGGITSAGNRDDTWAWDGSMWAEKMPSSSPAPRNRHSMAANSSRPETILHGGEGSQIFDDTWVWA